MPKLRGRPTNKALWKQRIAEKVTKLNDDTVGKLGQAFAIGANVREACSYADIHYDTYYEWIKKNPQLSEYFEEMRQRLPLKAKTNIAEAIHNKDMSFSRWLIERKQPGEYGETLNLNHSGEITSSAEQDKETVARFHAELASNRLKRSREKSKNEDENIK